MMIHSFAKGLRYREAREASVFEDGQRVNECTVARWYSRLRRRVVEGARNQQRAGGKIGGPGVIVQVDEALIGRRKYYRGRSRRGVWVVGMVDERGQVRMEVCRKRSAPILERIVRRHVLRGSTVHTDCWRAYSRLGRLGYTHSTVNHSARGRGRFVARDGTHTQRIEACWRALRRFTSPGGRRIARVREYLLEYMWRRRCARTGADELAELVKLLRV